MKSLHVGSYRTILAHEYEWRITRLGTRRYIVHQWTDSGCAWSYLGTYRSYIAAIRDIWAIIPE
jgi:hypothetical protein